MSGYAYGKIISPKRACNSPPDRLGRLTLLRHACDVTVRIKLDPVSALFDGRHALRVENHLVAGVVIALLVFFSPSAVACAGVATAASPVLLESGTHANVIVDFWGAP